MSGPAARPTVGVCGLGLIGGSALLALRDAGFDVRGCDVWPEPRIWCEQQGIPADGSPEATARAVDVLLLCVPPHATAPVAAAALAANDELLVIDAASVKRQVVEDVRLRVPEHADRFLPAHPMAGAERGGHASARADLLRGAPWAVCPPASDPDGESATLDPLVLASVVLDALEARIVVCTADAHDRAVAATSHAPHLIAGAVAVEALTATDGPLLAAALSGGSLRDATRVAGAPLGLWLEVLHANADLTADALDHVADRLREAAQILRDGDHDRLEDAWNDGSHARQRIFSARWETRGWEPFAVPARWSALLALGSAGVAVRALHVDAAGLLAGERTVPDAAP